MIKESKILNSLLNDIYNIVYDEELIIDVGTELKAHICLYDDNSKHRAADFQYLIKDGIDLAQESLNTGKDIYCLYSERANIIMYFVENLTELKIKLTNYLKEIKEEVNLSLNDLNEEIKDLELQLSTLKKVKTQKKKSKK